MESGNGYLVLYGLFNVNLPQEEMENLNELSSSDEEFLMNMDYEELENMASSVLVELMPDLKEAAIVELPPPETPVMPKPTETLSKQSPKVNNELTTDIDCKKRFKSSTDDEIEMLFAARQAPATKKNTAWGMKLFQGTVVCIPNRGSAAVAAARGIFDTELDGIKEAGTWKAERVITSPQGSSINVKGQTSQILNFCANNYLGLSSHPEVIEAGKKALDTHGAGLSSVRFICGTMNLHVELEQKIASFHGKDDAILYASCFDANAGLFEVMLTPDDAVISDELNHASIIDGIRLCKAQRHRYKHRDMADLESQLEATKSCRMRLIVTDGVFSMDGNVAPLLDICDLAEKHYALVFIDECHGTGFFGPTGRGTDEYFGVSDRVDIINSTLGKALGGAAGGYTAGPSHLVTLLRQRSRPYLFSNALPPPVVACASKALDLIMQNPNLPQTVLSNTKHFRGRMKEAGFNLGGDPEHPICPVMLGDARLASVFADEMLERGIYVIGFSYPVVPKGKARIRVQISAAHSKQDIDRAADAFIEIGRKLKVIN